MATFVKSQTKMHHIQVSQGPTGIPDHALAIQQSFDPDPEGAIWEPQVLVIAESEDQCFQALESLHPELTKANLSYDRGSYYPVHAGAPYDGGGLILFIHQAVAGIEASCSLATFTMHMSQNQLSELQEFLVSIWA